MSSHPSALWESGSLGSALLLFHGPKGNKGTHKAFFFDLYQLLLLKERLVSTSTDFVGKSTPQYCSLENGDGGGGGRGKRGSMKEQGKRKKEKSKDYKVNKNKCHHVI